MKKPNKYLPLFLSSLLIILLLTSCGSKDASSNSQEDTGGAPSITDNITSPEEGKGEELSPLEPEKVITTIQMDFETTEFEKTIESLTQIIQGHKAYVENSNSSYNQYYNNKSYKYATYTIRVPKDQVSNFKNALIGIGNMTQESTSKEDVTKYYKDTASRLKVVTTKESRLLALMEKASKIEDIIALENQLSQTIYEKEQLQSTLSGIDDQVDFSTVHINIQEVEKLTNAESPSTGFGTRVKNAFSDSLYRFNIGIQNFVISLIYLAPFILLIGLLAFFVYLLTKKFKLFKNHKNKKGL